MILNLSGGARNSSLRELAIHPNGHRDEWLTLELYIGNKILKISDTINRIAGYRNISFYNSIFSATKLSALRGRPQFYA